MSKYTSETKRAVSMSAYKANTRTNVMNVEFDSIATAWRFISGYNPIHRSWNGRISKQRDTTYDALQATLKRDGFMFVDLVIDGVCYYAQLQYTSF